MRDVDKFTVDSENGNGDLTYSIGILTADEILMAGNTNYDGYIVITYLSIQAQAGSYVTLSPGIFFNKAAVFDVVGGTLASGDINAVHYVRPAVSLANETYLISGNGSFETPYTVG